MELHCELYDREKHYGMIASWWRRHDFPVVPAEVLGFGVVVRIDGVPRAAVFGFHDRYAERLAVIEFAVANPANKPKQSIIALQTAVECAKALLQKRGAVCVMSFFANDGLNRIMQKCGFISNEKGVESMIYVNGGEKWQSQQV
jgi:hypothetical protein